MRISVQKISECVGHHSPIYTLCAAAARHHFYSGGGDGYLVEWNEEQPQWGRAIASVQEQIFSILHIAEHRKVVIGTMNGGLFVLEQDSHGVPRNIRHHHGKGVFDLKYYQSAMISVGGDGILTRWNVEKWLPQESIQLSNRALRCLLLIETQNLWAVGASDGNIYLLNTDNLNLQHIVPTAHQHSVFSLAMLPDNQLLVSGGRDAAMHVWDSEKAFEKIASIAAHLYTINDIKISPNKKWLATASRDRTIKIWDAETLQLLKVIDAVRMQGHRHSVNKLLWQSEKLWSCSDDRSILSWEVAVAGS